MLVVDDEPAIRALIADVLAELGYNAIEAGDGAAGLRDAAVAAADRAAGHRRRPAQAA